MRATLAREITGRRDVCLTCSFQAEDVLLTKLAQEQDARIPVLFLDTGYHFAETYAYRDHMVREWRLNLINLLPEKTVAEQEAEHGLLYRRRPTSAAGCARWNRSSRQWRGMAFGSPDCAGNRRRAARRWKKPRLSRFPAAGRC